ncbi:hypothetical protein M422DRAFT_42148 [Sphaerobolus stellatus SS14]|nr:hypothetical protein M422DRAFT_42148 [Sphaerobolus stellatus SS14]
MDHGHGSVGLEHPNGTPRISTRPPTAQSLGSEAINASTPSIENLSIPTFTVTMPTTIPTPTPTSKSSCFTLRSLLFRNVCPYFLADGIEIEDLTLKDEIRD